MAEAMGERRSPLLLPSVLVLAVGLAGLGLEDLPTQTHAKTHTNCRVAGGYARPIMPL